MIPLIKAPLFLFLLAFGAFFVFPEAPSQNRLLARELETLAEDGAKPAEKKEAFKSMARLYQLSGNREKALEAWKAAFEVEPGSPDYGALLEEAKILVSMGEYEKALSELGKVPASAGEDAFSARLLFAKIEAFSARPDTRLLAQYSADPQYVNARAEIYYTLWRITGNDSWKTKLLAEFPRSPEALIFSGSGGQKVSAATTPQWLLFPGHEAGASGEVPPARNVSPILPVQQVKPEEAEEAGAGSRARAVSIQTGLYSREPNAAAMLDRLQKAGFKAAVIRRQIRGESYWAVMVDSGADSNRTILTLKNAGFEAFPVFE